MKNLVEKLRYTSSKGISVWGDLQMEAADTIEALQAERDTLRQQLAEAQRDAERYRIALSNCIDAIENCQCLLNLHDLEGFAKTCVGANNTAIELAHAAMKGAA
jgi:hypothetical protein